MKRTFAAERVFEAQDSPVIKIFKNRQQQDSLSKNYFFRFESSVKYMVAKIILPNASLKLYKNDVIEISMANGLIVYRNGKRQKQYKLIPRTAKYVFQPQCLLPSCAPITRFISYFVRENVGIDISNDGDKTYLSIYDLKKKLSAIVRGRALQWFMNLKSRNKNLNVCVQVDNL